MAGTTVAVRNASAEVVKPTEEYYPALASADALTDVIGLITDNVGDDGITLWDLPRIPMPIGGSTTWEIPAAFEGEESTSAKSIEGALVHWAPVRALFPRDEEGNPKLGEPPLCSAPDAKHPAPGGLYADGGERAGENPPVSVDGGPAQRSCAACPMAQWGSSVRGGRGQACQDRRLLFVLRPEDTLPVMLSVPPTSVKDLRIKMAQLTARYKVHFSSMILKFTLKGQEKGGNRYATLSIAPVGLLDGARPESQGGPAKGTAAWIAREYSKGIKSLLTPEAVSRTITVEQSGPATEAPPTGLFDGDSDYADGEFAEGEFAEGEFAEGEFAEGEFAEGEFDDDPTGTERA